MKFKVLLILFLFFISANVEAVTNAPVDITNMSLLEISEALEEGILTSEELVTLYLERIDAYNDDFNAIREINESALKQARELDEERADGNVRSVLHGTVVVIKTNIDTTELATTAGTKSLSDNYPVDDAEVISILKEAGVIVLASTNMSEFAFSATESYSSYGNVKNAFNTSYTPYGSSGGSAVALALSFASFALGTDTNSSVRVPSSAAGIVGLRPTYGLISTDGVIPYDILRDVVGIMTKTVDDNALVLSEITGDDYNYEGETLKIGVINSYMIGSSSGTGANSLTDSDISNLMQEKLSLLTEAGVELVYIDSLLDSTYLSIASSTMTGISFCDGFNEYISDSVSSIKNFTQLAYSSGHVYSLTGYLSGCGGTWESSLSTKNAKKEKFENHVLEVMEEYDVDVLVYPTVKTKATKLSNASVTSSGGSLSSVIGYPSLTVPMGYIDEFSYGIEFFTTKYDEAKLYSVASIFESANDLGITNSPLAPNLYEIPENVTSLVNIYKEYYGDDKYSELTLETKDFWAEYIDLSTDEITEKASNLLELYEQEKNKVTIIESISNNSMHPIILGILLVLALFVIIKKKRSP